MYTIAGRRFDAAGEAAVSPLAANAVLDPKRVPPFIN